MTSDYTELVKALRYCGDIGKTCTECKYYNDYCYENLSIEAADAIEELSRMVDASIPKSDAEIIISEVAKVQPKWIPVTERLPGDGEYVLAYSAPDDLMFVAARYSFENWAITHWMPLPQPPKEEEDK